MNKENTASKLIKTVLIALDYDSSARQVADQGYVLAKSLGAQAILVHVIADENYYSNLEYSPVTGFLGFEAAEFSRQLNANGLQKAGTYFLEQIRNHLSDEKINIRVEKGDTAEVILQMAKHHEADVIVMGSHSRRWLQTILLGSVTEKVMRSSVLPLFIVPVRGKKS